MFRKLHHRKGQNTAEYAILISLVVAGIIAMQTYAQRALHGRVQAASTLLSNQGTEDVDGDGWALDDIKQYEPYYLESDYDVDRAETRSQILTEGTDRAIEHLENSTRERAADGYQRSNYNNELFGEAW